MMTPINWEISALFHKRCADVCLYGGYPCGYTRHCTWHCTTTWGGSIVCSAVQKVSRICGSDVGPWNSRVTDNSVLPRTKFMFFFSKACVARGPSYLCTGNYMWVAMRNDITREMIYKRRSLVFSCKCPGNFSLVHDMHLSFNWCRDSPFQIDTEHITDLCDRSSRPAQNDQHF